jgi:hypothetical protein
MATDERQLGLGRRQGEAQDGPLSGRAPNDASPGTAPESPERARTEKDEPMNGATEEKEALDPAASSSAGNSKPLERTDTEPFDTGYHFPPSHGFVASFKLGALAFWKFAITPFGFAVVLYGLLVVAFGGQIFLLLCNAAPAMCHPDCNDINSPRRKWIEYDAQILNALFCVTGFGLAPWRIRDLYFLMRYRVRGDVDGWRRLAGIHRGWFRLRGSEDLPRGLGPENIEGAFDEGSMGPVVPSPVTRIPDAPLTGCRAPPTEPWKMDAVVWCNVWNTIMQAFLAGFMWGMNRYDRPPWTTGLFVGLAIVFAAVGGVYMFLEGKRVKSVEGVPLSDADRERLARDKELSIPHYVSAVPCSNLRVPHIPCLQSGIKSKR